VKLGPRELALRAPREARETRVTKVIPEPAENNVARTKRGRPKLHASSAAKQRAYRERKRAACPNS
jgi:hypothetical protein